MKTRSLLMIILALIITAGLSTELSGQSRRTNGDVRQSNRNENRNTIKIFNGKNLSNWTFYLKDQSVDPADVFTVEDGVIHIKGDPFGYMRTKESYSEYKLHLEYRWPKEATNSGIFIHALPPDTIWIKTFECQLAAGNAGDLICMSGAQMNEKRANSIVIKKMAPSAEKPVGEWNTIEITCKSNTIEVSVNGVIQNKGSELSADRGHICLQSEGKEIEFRNVNIVKLSPSGRR